MSVAKPALHTYVGVDQNISQLGEEMMVKDLPYGTLINWSQGLGRNLCILAYGCDNTATVVSLANPGCTYTVTGDHRVWVVGFIKRINLELHK